MNRTLSILVVMFAFLHNAWAQQLQQNEIIYTFSQPKDVTDQLDVTVEFLGDDYGRTQVITPWIGFSPYLGDNIFTFDIVNGQKVLGQGLNYTDYLHYPGEKFSVNYSVFHDKTVGDVTAPYIQKDFFSVDPTRFLIHPNIDRDKKIKFTFDFSALDEEYKIFTSFGIGKKITVESTLNHLYASRLVGTKIQPSCYDVNGFLLHVIENGSWPKLEEKVPAGMLAGLIKFQREVMDDYDFPYYIAIVNQQPNDVPLKNINGAHDMNILSLSLPDVPKDELDIITYTMVHEVFHGWLGNKIIFPISLNESYQWFYEGFTDYCTMSLARAANLISDEMYLNRLNHYAKEYYTEIYRHASNELYSNINKQFKHLNHSHFNNAKGFFLAQWFFTMVKEKNMSDNSIKLFIKELVALTYDKKQIFSEEIFWEAFYKFFNDDFKELIDKHIVNGELMTLPPIDGFLIQDENMKIVDLGFDVVETIKAERLIGLRENSAAFKAGLKENAICINHLIHCENGKIVRIGVTQKIDDEPHTISYDAEYIDAKIPQYVKL